MLVLKGLVGFYRTIQLQLFGVTGQGIDLGYCDIEWFALEMNRDHSAVFETAPKYCTSDSFVDYGPTRPSRTKHNHRKLTNLITWTTTLSNSTKL